MLEKAGEVRTLVNIASEDLCLYILQTYQWNE
jgi:hypothetical protein